MDERQRQAELQKIREYNRANLMSRRGFVKIAAAGVTTACGMAALSSCSVVNAAARGDSIGAAISGTRTITDDAGREVTMPSIANLERLYFTSGLAQVFCFTVDPELIAGTCGRFTADDLKFLPEGTADLPFMGSLSDGGEIDREMLIAEDIQLIFSISGVALTQANISDAERLQDQTGIPCFLIDGSFTRIADAYRLLGQCMGREQHANEIGDYCERKFSEVQQALEGLAEEDKVSVYYAEGPEGLQTEPAESQHSVAFLYAGARDVATVPLGGNLGMSNVNLEQITSWDPDIIISWDDRNQGGADEDIRTNPNWSGISAVRNKRVYTMPSAPYAWCDRPPGVNRLIGIQWMANLFYPDRYPIDIVAVVKDFYKTMYWVDVDDDTVKQLLGNSFNG